MERGCWAYPQRFAATASICGDPYRACALKDTPIWAFHGAKKDEVVDPVESKQMVEAVRACGGLCRLTIYPDADHDSWAETYDNLELYNWLLKHTLDV